METNLKKIVPILSVLCFAMTSAFAGGYEASDDKDSGKKHAVPPGEYGMGEDSPNIFVSVDYTLWTAREAGLAVAASNFYATAQAPALGSVFYPDWKLRSGFKVGLGANVGHDGWDVQAQYTWFYNKNNKLKAHSMTAGQAISVWRVDPSSNQVALNAVSSSWNNWFNRIDVELARSFYAGHYLAYRPWIGLLGAWDEQWFEFDYTDTNSTVYYYRNSQKFWGIGPYAGTDASFFFTNEWALFLTSGASLPWSKYDAKTKQNTNSTGTTSKFYTQNTFWNVSPMFELALGLRWDTWWSDNSWHFRLQAGWEQQVWFSHNNMFAVGTDGDGSGNYSMQGLTIKARANF